MYNIYYRAVARVSRPEGVIVTYLGYAALFVLALAALIAFLRSYKDYGNGLTGRTLVDLGLSLSAIFVALVLAAYMSTSAQALITGSPALVVVMTLLLGASLLLIAAGKLRKTKVGKPVKKGEGDDVG